MEETMFSKEVERERERVERVNSNLNIIRLTHTYPKNEFGFNNNPNHHFDLMYSNHSGGRWQVFENFHVLMSYEKKKNFNSIVKEIIQFSNFSESEQ